MKFSTDYEYPIVAQDILNADFETLASGQTGFSVEGYVQKSGVVASDTYRCTDYISVEPGQLLRLTKCRSTGFGYAYFYTMDKEFLIKAAYPTTGSFIESIEAVVPDGAAYVRATCNIAQINVATVSRLTGRIAALVDDPAIGWLERLHADTGLALSGPFTNVRANAPIFTLVDDDTVDLDQVRDFRKICEDNKVPGTFAVITSLVTDSMREELLACERAGHQSVIHCHVQSGTNDYWDNADDYPAECEANLVLGLQEMKALGLTDYKHWVSPRGSHKDTLKRLARKWGLDCLVSITQNAFVGYDQADRYFIPRMELYPEDEGHGEGQTLAGIKAMVDRCVAGGGWLLVGTHVNTWHNADGQPDAHAGDTDDTRFRERYARIYEMLAYAADAGMRFVSLGEAFRIWEPVIKMYETF